MFADGMRGTRFELAHALSDRLLKPAPIAALSAGALCARKKIIGQARTPPRLNRFKDMSLNRFKHRGRVKQC